MQEMKERMLAKLDALLERWEQERMKNPHVAVGDIMGKVVTQPEKKRG